jgi:FHA domain
MITTDMRQIHIELDALDSRQTGTAHWAHDLDLRRQEFKVRIGSREDADIVLPPARFPRIARLHCAIVFQPDRTFLELYNPQPETTLDGKPAAGATLDPGTHELAIGDDRFRLTITTRS